MLLNGKSNCDFHLEKPHWEKNTWVIGVDEVGRGPFAGPITTAAVCFKPNDTKLEKAGINDSKRLSELKRTTLNTLIHTRAYAVSIKCASAGEINTYGLSKILRVLIEETVHAILKQIPKNQSCVALIDGRFPAHHFSLPCRHECIIRGDQQSVSIAAASIIAKVHRDLIMCQLGTKYPHYGFEQNKGYGTLKHRRAIQTHGATPHHRQLFIRKTISSASEQPPGLSHESEALPWGKRAGSLRLRPEDN